MSDAAHHAALLARGQVHNHYQPIVNLQSGTMLGVEVLGRLADGPNVIAPGCFLPDFDTDQLARLLMLSLHRGLQALSACASSNDTMFMSFNVSPGVLLQRRFATTLWQQVDGHGIDPRRVTLEILEDDEFLNLPAACRVVAELRRAGFQIALDDVGIGYSSLNRLRELSVDKIKLDQAFVRALPTKPEGLHFVAAMQSLARGLHGTLVVEGVETAEIMAALGVLGVEAVQGYAIARPMPRAALVQWVQTWRAEPIDRRPRNLLGAYAAHLSIVEACRALFNQPLRFSWAADVRNPHACAIGRYFDENGLHDTPYGLAHKHFHAVIDQYQTSPEHWEKAASALWQTLQNAIKSTASQKPTHACEYTYCALPALVCE